jgi:predicted negative regulator of RcsB-dependent stress response
MVVFLWAVSRRSYLAVALPVTFVLGAINALAFWIGWTMFTATDEEEEEYESALEEVPSTTLQP